MKRYIYANASNRAEACRILNKYSDEQIAFVQRCDDDLKAEISKQFVEDWDPEVSAINLNAVKTDWMLGAIEDNLLTEEEFEEILSALDILDTESANAWA